MKDITLLVMAAGMGSRYGGLKQLDAVGPSDETIIDFSVYDAIRTGYNKVVFIIREDFEKQFKEKISNEDLLNFEKITYILETQNPDHKPGEKTYYHAKTHGYLVENLIRRITKKSLKEFFNENFSKKYDLNFNFGFKEDDFYNVSDLIENNIEHEETNQEFNAFNNPKHEINFYNH